MNLKCNVLSEKTQIQNPVVSLICGGYISGPPVDA